MNSYKTLQHVKFHKMVINVKCLFFSRRYETIEYYFCLSLKNEMAVSFLVSNDDIEEHAPSSSPLKRQQHGKHQVHCVLNNICS